MFHIVLYCFISLGGSCWRILELQSPLEGQELTACDEWIAPSRAVFFCFSLHPWSSLLFPGPPKAPPLISLLLNLKHVCAQALQLCPSLCEPMDSSPLGSSVHGISHARILEWVAISFSRGSSRARDRTHVSYVSCIGMQVLYHWHHLGSPYNV